MRLTFWVTIGLAAAVLAGEASADDVRGARGRLGLYVAGEQNPPERLGLYDTAEPVAPAPIAGQGRGFGSSGSRRLGPIQKLRRGRYVMSRFKELKAARGGAGR